MQYSRYRPGVSTRPLLKRMPASSKGLKAQVADLRRRVTRHQPELKSYQLAASFTNVVSGSGAIIYLSPIAQGTDVDDRIGDKVHMHSIAVKFKVTGGLDSTAGSLGLVGVYLIKDLQSNGVVPTVAGTSQSIFVNPGPVQAMINPTTKDRFKLIRSYVYGSYATYSGNQLPLGQFASKANHIMTYHDSTTAQTGAGKNAYYLVCLTDSNDTTDLATYSEIRFTDA